MSDSCATCFYFGPESAEITDRGYCRRRPPTVFRMGTGSGGPTFLSIFPPMQAAAWCGEHWDRAADIAREKQGIRR